MKILFLHRDFPGQFKYLITVLKAIGCEIYFITEEKSVNFQGVKKFTYTPRLKQNSNDSFLTRYENIFEHAKCALEILTKLKEEGFKPDIIYGFSPWGLHLGVKEIFPDVPLISYCEWFYNSQGADIGFDSKKYNYKQLCELKLKNSHLLVDLYSSDYCISPMQWQKEQFPKEFQDKIKVIYDGIDCNFFKPNENATFEINGKIFSKNDEIITYVSRGFEAYRGFEQFIKAVDIILKKRPEAQILIAGCDKIFYGNSKTKEECLKEVDLDLSRVHFTGVLPPAKYLQLLQISSCHIYLTYPFILSWSFMEALSTGCPIVCSNTAPVKEVIKDNFNGILAEFFDYNQIAQKVCDLIEDKNLSLKLSENARRTVLENYDIKKVIPMHVEMINQIMQNKKM